MNSAKTHTQPAVSTNQATVYQEGQALVGYLNSGTEIKDQLTSNLEEVND